MYNRKAATVTIYLLMFACAAVLVIISPMLDEIAKEFSLTTVQMGMLMAFQFIGFTIFTILGGVMADRVSKKVVLSIAVVSNCILLFAFSAVQSFPAVLVLLFLMGGATGILESMTSSFVADVNPENRTFHINFIQVMFGVGALTMPLIAGYALSIGVSWRSVYVMVGALYIVVAAAFILVKAPKVINEQRITLAGVKTILSNKYFIMTCICLFCYTGAEVGVWGWMSAFTKETMHFDVLKSNMTVGFFWGMMIVTRVILSFASSRISAKKIAVLLACFSIPATVFVALASSEPMVWLSVILIGICYSAQYPMILAYGTENMTQSTGTVFAIAFAAGGVGMSAVPYLMGLLGEAFGSRISLFLPALLFGIIVITLTAFYRPEKAPKKEGQSRRKAAVKV